VLYQIKLGGQFVVVCPAYVLGLLIARRVNSEVHPARGNLLSRNHIDRIVLRAIEDEEIHLALVAPAAGPASIRLDALSAALDDAPAQSSGLALSLKEFTAAIEHEVITLVHPEREQHSIAPLDQLREDCGLGPMAYINWMRCSPTQCLAI
jgi:hypothetical protein